MGKRVLALVFVLALLTGTFSSALAAETEIDYNISREVRVLGHLADDAAARFSPMLRRSSRKNGPISSWWTTARTITASSSGWN